MQRPAAARLGFLMLLAALLPLGCQSTTPPAPTPDTFSTLFAPVSMRIHPIFTQVKNWTGNDKPDGVEALLEFQDQFGDPTKASGTVLFELYHFQKYDPNRKGDRVCNPWQGDLSSLADQRGRWNRTSRTYTFQLAVGGLTLDQDYLLTAEFQRSDGGRFFDQLVLERQINRAKYGAPDFGLPPTSQPTSEPTTEPAFQPLQPGSTSGPVSSPGMRTPSP